MLRTTALFLTLSTAALAEVPQVMTDIAPIQSLAARVMAGIGAPDVLLPPGASPHDYALRPSDAARLAETDLMIWVGHGLTPWLEGPIASLAADAQHLELLKTTGWTALPSASIAAPSMTKLPNTRQTPKPRKSTSRRGTSRRGTQRRLGPPTPISPMPAPTRMPGWTRQTPPCS